MHKMTTVVLFLLLGLRPLAAAPPCVGDCDDAGTVTVDELVKGVGIALGSTSVEQCAAVDGNANGVVTVDELVTAVNDALNGCPDFIGEYFGSVDLDAGESATMDLTVDPDGTASALVTISDGNGGLGAELAAWLAGRGGANPPFSFSITGTVDLDTGEYSLSGSFLGPEQQPIPVEAHGMLPLQANAHGTFAFTLGPDTFDGFIVQGDGLPPTPTRTPPAASTPTFTATPGSRPTPAPGCGGGHAEATFSNASGVNANQPLTGTIQLTKVEGTLNFIDVVSLGTLGGVLNKCPIEEFGVTRTIGWTVTDTAPIAAGKTYPLALLNYSEATAAPSLQTWKATGGTLTVDSVVGDTVTVHVTDAHMEPGPPFVFGPPAMGTFTLSFTATIDAVVRP